MQHNEFRIGEMLRPATQPLLKGTLKDEGGTRNVRYAGPGA